MARPRKIAPNVTVRVVDIPDERAEIVQTFAPECVAKMENGKEIAPDWHAFFGDPNIPIEHYVRKGYTPIKMQDGSLVTHKGDPLMKIEQAKHIADLKRSGAISRALAEQAQSGEGEKYEGGLGTLQEMSRPGD